MWQYLSDDDKGKHIEGLEEKVDELTHKVQRLERWVLTHAPLIPHQNIPPQDGAGALEFWLLRDADEEEKGIWNDAQEEA